MTCFILNYSNNTNKEKDALEAQKNLINAQEKLIETVEKARENAASRDDSGQNPFIE